MKKTATTTLNASQDVCLRRYATLGLGTAVLVGTVTTMDASVVYTNYNNLVLNDTNTTDTSGTVYGYDINGDGSQDFRLITRNEGSTSTANYARISAGVTGSSFQPINVVGATVSNFNYPSRLGAGVSISAAQNFITLALTPSSYYLAAGSFAFGNGFPNSKWRTAGANSGYLGFSFTAADGLHYGFAQLTVAAQGNGALSRSFTLSGIGYESTPNTAITTFAAVPEPSSIALAALGGVGIAALRRRKAAKAKAATE